MPKKYNLEEDAFTLLTSIPWEKAKNKDFSPNFQTEITNLDATARGLATLL